MKKFNIKKYSLMLAIAGVFLTLVGVTYALYSYLGLGSKYISISSNGVTFSYLESKTSLSLTDAIPKPDEIGKTDSNYFEFYIRANSSDTIKIPYYITTRKTDSSSNIDDAIKLYLTRVSENGNEEEVALVKFADLRQYTNSGIDLSKYVEKLLYNTEVPIGKGRYRETYRLRMWIDLDTNFVESKYNNATFSVKINVYAKDKVVTGERGTVTNPIEFNNVASLKNGSVTTGTYVSTLGYYAVNDGGDAVYLIEDDNGQTIDNGKYIKLDNGKIAKLNINNKTINVKQFGAYGDSIEDDSLYVQNAFNALSDEIDTIYFPSGTYKVSKSINMKSGTYKGGSKSTILVVDKDSDKEYVFSNILSGKKDDKDTIKIDSLNFEVDTQSNVNHIYILRFFHTVNSSIINTNLKTADTNTTGITFIDLYTGNNYFDILSSSSTLTSEDQRMSTHIAIRERYENNTTSNIVVDGFSGIKNGKDESIWIDAWNGSLSDVEVKNSTFIDNGIAADTVFMGANYQTSHAKNINFHDNTITKYNYSYKVIALACTESTTDVSGISEDIIFNNNTIEIKSILPTGLVAGTGVIHTGSLKSNSSNDNIVVSNNTIKAQDITIGSVVKDASKNYKTVASNNTIMIDKYSTNASYFDGVYSYLKEVSGGNITKYDGSEASPAYVFRNTMLIQNMDLTITSSLLKDYLSPVDEVIRNVKFKTKTWPLHVLANSTKTIHTITVEDSEFNHGSSVLVSAWYTDTNTATSSGNIITVELNNTITSNTKTTGSVNLIK